jgi:hypothetical protein
VPRRRRFADFPERPRSFRGRERELDVLVRLVTSQHPTAVALVGGGGSGKSTLACALGHALSKAFSGRIAWARIGAWDRTTVLQMIALKLGLGPGSDPLPRIRGVLSGPPSLVVLDNHEDDATTAATLEALRGTQATFVLTARRCLLGGVTIFPVVPALVSSQKSPFRSVARLTRLLRWHPVALDLADALVTTGVLDVDELERRLVARGVSRIEPLAHEDDVPEVRGVVLEALAALAPASRRMLAVLAHMRGDRMDRASLVALSDAGRAGDRALERLRALRLVQEPSPEHYALHATVSYALHHELGFDEDRVALHYLSLFERDPGAIEREETHLFSLMDWAQAKRDLGVILRVHALAEAFEGQAGSR